MDPCCRQVDNGCWLPWPERQSWPKSAVDSDTNGEYTEALILHTRLFYVFDKSHFVYIIKVCVYLALFQCLIYSIKYGFGWLNCAISSYIQGNYKKFINFFPITILKLNYQSSLLKFLCHTIKPQFIIVLKILFLHPLTQDIVPLKNLKDIHFQNCLAIFIWNPQRKGLLVELLIFKL